MNTPINTSHEQELPIKGDNKERDIFSDPALENAAINDPVYLFMKTWWRQIAIVLAAVLIATYFIGAFRDTYRASMESAADVFHRLQSEYDTLAGLKSQLNTAQSDLATKSAAKPSEPKEIENAQKKVDDLQKSLEELKGSTAQLINSLSYAKDPYNRLGSLYAALIARNLGEKDALNSKFTDFKNWKASGKAESAERFYAELGAIVLARALLDDEASFNDGRLMLVELAKDGSYVNVSAALSLASIAAPGADAKEVLTILETINTNSPEQADLLRAEIKRLKAS